MLRTIALPSNAYEVIMPYQIIHAFEGLLAETPVDGISIVLAQEEATPVLQDTARAIESRLLWLKEGGIDGLVVNVGGGERYLESEEAWALFRQGVEIALRLGFRLWIYDEEGYPSGSAKGLVLRDHPELEARGIKCITVTAEHNRAACTFYERGAIQVLRCEALYANGRWQAIGTETNRRHWSDTRRIFIEEQGLEALRVFYIATLYEGSHAARNYGEKRRYINLLDPRAVARFIEVTHHRYAQRLSHEAWAGVEAFFTDEPSLMSVVVRDLDGDLSQPIPVLDPPDPRVSIAPSVPYSEVLRTALAHDHGFQLEESIQQLFIHSEDPSPLKCAFWDGVSRTYEQSFAIPLAHACAKLGKALTGHLLFEETPFANAIFHANPFRVLKHFQLPGVDLLSSQPAKISVFGHKLPFSCAFLTGKPGIMTESSDFVESLLEGNEPASPEQMAMALSLQFLLGVRTFSYYFNPWIRDKASYRWVNDVVRRTCAYAAKLVYAPDVALYVPYETFWSGYTPSTLPLHQGLLEAQPNFVQRAEQDTLQLCDDLWRENISFILCDESSLTLLPTVGTSRVIVPECHVVTETLVTGTRAGGLTLYGHRPPFCYSHGQLHSTGDLEVHPIEELDPSPMPFVYEEGLRIADYRGGHYYVLNPTDRELIIELAYTTSIYDPFVDRQRMSWEGRPVRIGPGRGLFLKI